ncbi:universal stress protein [Atopococcus tabaci]|uniref:universal stress protein n=1 Tax=Atopococcus tabaci TaxID=269774 RepID=UPI00240952F5|nr:universal stress protein [Atopococcus tabaci]
MRRIVLGYDGSAVAEKDINDILALAKGFPDLHIDILYVIPYNQAEDETIDLTGKFSRTNEERIRSIKEHFKALAEQHVSHSVEIVIGNPAERIIEYATVKDADLIMVGHRGLNPLREAFVGSVSRKVIRESPIPVYVIK